MNKHLVFIQFVKDGLVGLAAICLIYAGIALAAFFLFYDSLFSTLRLISTLMLPLCLIMFISVGINGRFIENSITRKNWGKPILKMAGVAWFVTFVMEIIVFWGTSVTYKVSELYPSHNFDSIYQALHVYLRTFYNIFHDLLSAFLVPYFTYPLIGSGMVSILLAFMTAYLFAVIFNPEKRLHKLFIPVIASIFIIIGIPLGWFLGFMVSASVYGFELGLHYLMGSVL